MGLLQTLCLVKMDTVDGSTAAKKQVPATPRATGPARSCSAANAGASENMDDSPRSDADGRDKVETEMKGEREPGQVWGHFYMQYCRVIRSILYF